MNDTTNSIICGDCQDRMREHIEDSSIDLIYMDPPFFSGKNYEIIWKDGAERRSFEDTKFYTLVCECGKVFPEKHKFCAFCGAGKDKATERRSNDIEAYLQWLRPKLEECKRVLKPTGSIYVHLDYHAVHYVKQIMDDIFGNGDIDEGMKYFRNEIVWHYNRWTAASTNYQRMHDTILFYTKDKKEWTFNKQYKEYSEASKKAHEERGYIQRGSYKSIPNPKGVSEDDVWDVQHLAGRSKERRGVPTQKPEALLERIIKASSNPGDIVLDPFCGCGTAVAVSQRLDRKWIGIDVSPTSCKVMVERLQEQHVRISEHDIINLPRTAEELRIMDPFEFQNWVVKQLDGKINPKSRCDGGIDGWTYKTDEWGMRHKQIGLNEPIQVKRSNGIGFPEIQKFIGAMQTDTKTDGMRGIFVAFSFVKTVVGKLKNLKNETGISVRILTVEDLLEMNKETK